MRTTFPRKSAIRSGSELIQPEIPANSGAVASSDSGATLLSVDTVGDGTAVGIAVGVEVWHHGGYNSRRIRATRKCAYEHEERPRHCSDDL